MTSKFKDPTENTQPLSYAAGTEEQVQPSLPSARTDDTNTSTQITPLQSNLILNEGNESLTTPVTTVSTTVRVSERSRQHADIAKAALAQLEKVGLIKRYKVLSAGSTTVLKIRIEFDTELWTEGLELK